MQLNYLKIRTIKWCLVTVQSQGLNMIDINPEKIKKTSLNIIIEFLQHRLLQILLYFKVIPGKNHKMIRMRKG